MVGILVQLALSWVLLYFFQKQHLSVLGLITDKKNVQYAVMGFLLMALLCVAQQLFEAQMANGEWVINKQFEWSMLFKGLYQDFKSVAFEELIFRGALLYIMIKTIGEQRAVLISASAFGIYHWFSFGILGMFLPMLVIFLGTGLMGYAFAKAFAKTGSILIPFAMHLGWNFFLNSIFSKGPYGEMIFILEVDSASLAANQLLFTFSSMFFIPLLAILWVHKGIHRQKRWS